MSESWLGRSPRGADLHRRCRGPDAGATPPRQSARARGAGRQGGVDRPEDGTSAAGARCLGRGIQAEAGADRGGALWLGAPSVALREPRSPCPSSFFRCAGQRRRFGQSQQRVTDVHRSLPASPLSSGPRVEGSQSTEDLLFRGRHQLPSQRADRSHRLAEPKLTEFVRLRPAGFGVTAFAFDRERRLERATGIEPDPQC